MQNRISDKITWIGIVPVPVIFIRNAIGNGLHMELGLVGSRPRAALGVIEVLQGKVLEGPGSTATASSDS